MRSSCIELCHFSFVTQCFQLPLQVNRENHQQSKLPEVNIYWQWLALKHWVTEKALYVLPYVSSLSVSKQFCQAPLRFSRSAQVQHSAHRMGVPVSFGEATNWGDWNALFHEGP